MGISSNIGTVIETCLVRSFFLLLDFVRWLGAGKERIATWKIIELSGDVTIKRIKRCVQNDARSPQTSSFSINYYTQRNNISVDVYARLDSLRVRIQSERELSKTPTVAAINPALHS